MSPELPQVGMSFLKKAMLACIGIVLMTAAAVSAAGLLEIKSLTDELADVGPGRELVIPKDTITAAEAGEPRTFMVLGTDERYGDKKLGLKPRSDTIVLLRADPRKKAIAVMSIPRDLLVEIPGYSERQKINSAFTLGGPKLAVKTVETLLSTPERKFEVNHLVTINFGGFRRAIDYIGCVYADIDRRYFNDNSGGTNYATIDVQPGYQKMCGQDALDYVRFRHNDNDLIRSARQQDFIRQIKSQDRIRSLADFAKRREIIRIFRRYFSYDRSLREPKTIISVLKLLINTSKNEIQEIGFKIDLSKNDQSYLYTTPELLEKTVDEFMAAEASDAPRQRARATKEDREFAKKSKKKRKNRTSEIPGLEVARQEGENMAVLGKARARFPFYFPTLRTRGSRYAETEPRVYSIRDADGRLHRAYRLVLFNGRFGEYYGVQGTQWRNPPILDNPSYTKVVDGRKLYVYRDGKRIRLVAWKTPKAAYWVSNSLNQAVTNRQMLGIAASLRRLGQK